MSIDAAVIRLQVLAKACAGVKSAPTYPIENANECPFSVAYFGSGEVASQSSTVKFNPTINVEFFFSPANLANAYKQIDATALEFSQRLCGDPRLGGAVETIVFPVSFVVIPTKWDTVPMQSLKFTIPLKSLESTTATP